MKLPISIAKQLLHMQQGNKIPAAQMKHTIVQKLLDDNIIAKQRIGANRNLYFLTDNNLLAQYISNHFGIDNLELYVEKYEQENLTRSEAVQISSDSKLKSIRTFKGFLVNCYKPIQTILNNKKFTLQPAIGSFIFIHDFEKFSIPENKTIVGVENAENFRFIQQQQYLFNNIEPLFISRYPQTQYNDVLQWLKSINNPYLHFGDFDIEGINIYLREFKQHLKERATFFIPPNIENLLHQKGNRTLYNQQIDRMIDSSSIKEKEIIELLNIIHKHKKGLEQEVLINL
jgi:hypothetical protein